MQLQLGLPSSLRASAVYGTACVGRVGRLHQKGRPLLRTRPVQPFNQLSLLYFEGFFRIIELVRPDAGCQAMAVLVSAGLVGPACVGPAASRRSEAQLLRLPTVPVRFGRWDTNCLAREGVPVPVRAIAKMALSVERRANASTGGAYQSEYRSDTDQRFAHCIPQSCGPIIGH